MSSSILDDSIRNAVSTNNIEFIEVPYYQTEIRYQTVYETEELTEEDFYNYYMTKLTDENRQEWYKAYKVLVADADAPPLSIYDVFTDDELDLLFRCVQTEIGSGDFNSKCNVAQVIINRWEDSESTLSGIITAPNQFCYSASRSSVTAETILACEYAFQIGVEGLKEAKYFHSGARTETFNGKPLIYYDGFHYFY